jgi:peptide deformylase
MKERRLYCLPEPVLRQKAHKVKNIDNFVLKLIDDMMRIMREESGAGLAAPQAGESLRVIILLLPDDTELVVINPEIVKTSDEVVVQEGCLSVPGYWAEIHRYNQATIKGKNRQGKNIRLKGEGRLAQAFQHEIDHLNGTLYIDRVEKPEDLHEIE